MVRHAFVSHRRTEEALTWVQRGRELDPLAISGVDIGWILFQARRYDDAFALWLLGFALIANNQAKEAIPVLEKALSGSDRSPGDCFLRLIVGDQRKSKKPESKGIVVT